MAAGQPSYLNDYAQLTHGGQNAEAYWAPDGKRLIFQTTRPPYECDQIFIMNADGSDQHLVSTGKGRTTCGYFLADDKHIVYASTHLAGEACPTPPDRSKGYVWGVFAGIRHFRATDDGQDRKAADGDAGLRRRGDGELEDREHGIHVAGIGRSGFVDHEGRTGSGKKQLTKTAGYDGGAVFSRDGKKLVWRAESSERRRERWRDTKRCWRIT